MAQREAADLLDDGTCSLTGADIAIRAAAQRRRDAQHRTQAAGHRALAAHDRLAAARDREQAAGERLRALVDRGAIAAGFAQLAPGDMPAELIARADSELNGTRRAHDEPPPGADTSANGTR